MIRALLIAYTTYIHDGRVRRHAEALATRGDHVDVICLGSPGRLDGVNVIGLDIPRYRGGSRSSYLNSYFRFFLRATAVAMRLNSGGRYDVVIACTMPDAVVLCTLPFACSAPRWFLMFTTRCRSCIATSSAALGAHSVRAS